VLCLLLNYEPGWLHIRMYYASQKVMRDPVLCADGHSYERAAIAAWVDEHGTSPLTGAHVSSEDLVPNHALRCIIAELMAAGAA